MLKKGTMQLPLHYGHAPQWLVKRMEKLADATCMLLIMEHGRREFLRRISDPLWFQAFGCVLGFDWHSSGLTTVVTGVLKQALKPDVHGVMLAGGKGKSAVNAKHEIATICENFNISGDKTQELLYASRISAKVDNAALQDGYSLYHHAFLLGEDGSWAVVQQGMNADSRMARRYHWASDSLQSFVNEPHTGIISDSLSGMALDMTAALSAECRQVCVDVANSDTNNIRSSLERLPRKDSLDRWIGHDGIEAYAMPWNIDWNLFRRVYDIRPRNYEELLAIKGVGPSAVRSLALIAQLVYGARPSWNDPVKFTFAHGGKDGVPYPVDRSNYDRSIRFLAGAVEGAELESRTKINALKRLEAYARTLYPD